MAEVGAREPLLRVRGLRTWFPIKQGILRRTVGHVKAVDDVSLDIRAGETLALVGESGCGKTTAGRSILRLEQALEGEVWFDGVDLLSLPRGELLPYRRKLQFVFQDPMASLDPRMRVREIVAEGLRSFGIGKTQQEQTDRVAHLLERGGGHGSKWRATQDALVQAVLLNVSGARLDGGGDAGGAGGAPFGGCQCCARA